MKKVEMIKLLDKIEDYYERNEKLFLETVDKETEGEVSQTEENDKKELEMLISSMGSKKASRLVHMPGYPE